MESQPQNPEFSINPENFHPCKSLFHHKFATYLFSCWVILHAFFCCLLIKKKFFLEYYQSVKWFGSPLGHYLHPYFVYAISEGSGDVRHASDITAH